MNRLATLLSLVLALAASTQACAQYDQHVVFDNVRADHWFYYSNGSAVAPSTVELDHEHLPLATDTVHSPPNSLRLSWRSLTGGSWEVSINTVRGWRPIPLTGDTLSFWVRADAPLAADDAPRLAIVGDTGVAPPAISLLGTLKSLPAGEWTKISVPFSSFAGIYRGTSDTGVTAEHLAKLEIFQGLDDGAPHTLWLDDIRVDDSAVHPGPPPAAPTNLAARGYERHLELEWAAVPQAESYRVYRADAAGAFKFVAVQSGRYTRFEDFVGAPDRAKRYRITAVDEAGDESAPSPIAQATTRTMSDEELLTMVQQGNFRYYWDGAHPNAGMAIEITPGDPDLVAVGSSGFGIMAVITGAERGFISRDAARERLEKICRFLDHADRFHGAWPHYLNGRTGRAIALFGKYDDGGDLVETAFLTQGLLSARGYFDRDTPAERELRRTISRLWEGIEWDWYRQKPDSDFLYWHWSPDYGFYINHPLVGWNETLIAYLLAIASPTHGVPASLWHSGWAGQSPMAVAYRRGWSHTREGDHYVNGHSYYGIPLAVGEGNGAELFFTQFSFLGFDPRDKRDAYANYFDNNRAIAQISQAYAMDNPRHFQGYGEDAWGQSAGQHTGGGRARPADDNGTLVVHAALGSMPYTPEASLKALRHYYRDLGAKLWGVYGFSDAFNPSDDWYEEEYAGLNQAQSVVMIENYRTGLLWRCFMANPEISPALQRIGFHTDHSLRRR
jgi:exo beta-1,2-glucooligosaccharide sophorohydrolase (non-reducing end)